MNNIQHPCQECGATNSFPWKKFIDGKTGEEFFKCTYCIVEDNVDETKRIIIKMVEDYPVSDEENTDAKAAISTMKTNLTLQIKAIKSDR